MKIHLVPHGNIIRAGDLHFPEFSFYDYLAFLACFCFTNLIFASMVASSSHIDSTKKSLYPISVTTFEWSSSLLSLLENCGHPLLWMLCLLMEKVIFKLARATRRLLSLWKQSKMRRANLVVFVASKTATSPPSANHAKTSSSASLQTWQGSIIPHFLNFHLFSDSHPFRIAVVKELVITVQPFSAFLGPLDGPRKNTTC